MYLEELTKYKQEIMKNLCESTEVIELLSVDPNNTIEYGEDLICKQIFPYGYVPNIQNKENVFICIDVEVPRTNGSTFKDVAMHLYIFAHHNLMKTPHGTRIDVLADKIDRLLNMKRGLGIGAVQLRSVKRFMPADTYYGVELCYDVTDFNNLGH